MKQLLIGLCIAAIAGFSAHWAQSEETAPAKPEGQAMEKAAAYYVCQKCCMMDMKPGKCAMCGAELMPMHLLGIKDGMGYFCSCSADCKCKLPAEGDLTKCSCGKDIVKVGLKGKYVCGCGPACKCNTVSDKPGKCGCGTEMKKVE